MQFKNGEITELTGKTLKHLTTDAERLEIAERRGISIHTLNAVLSRQRKVTPTTVRAVLDVTHLSIRNAVHRDTTLATMRAQLAEYSTQNL